MPLLPEGLAAAGGEEDPLHLGENQHALLWGQASGVYSQGALPSPAWQMIFPAVTA